MPWATESPPIGWNATQPIPDAQQASAPWDDATLSSTAEWNAPSPEYGASPTFGPGVFPATADEGPWQTVGADGWMSPNPYPSSSAGSTRYWTPLPQQAAGADEGVLERLAKVEAVLTDLRDEPEAEPADLGPEELFDRLDDPGVLGRLAERLYPSVRRRLRAELLIDRERHGALRDLR
ncbi:hypothetical protein FB561_0450 [Kribbella amoyensis]|uniref:Uncharacterized protein n=1 Tax=Kribbella amoyensis TaxID=996641 RepID=A0A561BKV1_9ACTN|nr:hypothetical protein [Kribbella amoyensis]TWD79392.1 hypothetical protein FB561_0450 [Kribbella amoyensis]